MKKFYFLTGLLCATLHLNAQISGCNDPAGGIQIIFDESQNCSAAPGDLAGLTSIGFHSGANQWNSVVDWNASGAITAQNNGNDVFTVSLADPDAYYGTSVQNIFFVFNQGTIAPSSPWDAEGKKDDGGGGCADFSIALSSITQTCANTTSSRDLQLQNDISIFPNPTATIANISIDTDGTETFSLQLTTLTGKLVREIPNFTGGNYELHKGKLASGIYFLKIYDNKGRFTTEKVVFN